MYNSRKVLCLILARGGSKGVPRKNVKLLAGKPLIKHSIDVAKHTKYIDQIYVSTDDEEIKNVSIQAGAQVVDRPSSLATDITSSLAAAQHALGLIRTHPDSIIVFLQATSPIRSPIDVGRCIELLDCSFDCVISISDIRIHPTHMFEIHGGENYQLLVRFDKTLECTSRQQMKKLYAHNGSIVVITARSLQNQKTTLFGGKIKGYLLDEESSMDIDTQLDFDICEMILKTRENK